MADLPAIALMLELVDRLALGASARKSVRVQISLRAQHWQAGTQRLGRCGETRRGSTPLCGTLKLQP